jgi:AraC-like DNA-binding protein
MEDAVSSVVSDERTHNWVRDYGEPDWEAAREALTRIAWALEQRARHRDRLLRRQTRATERQAAALEHQATQTAPRALDVWLTPSDVAELRQCSVSTARRLMREVLGRRRCTRGELLRVTRQQIEAHEQGAHRRKAKLPRHIYWRGGALYGWYYGPDGRKIKRSTGCTDPIAAAAQLAEWERDATDPASASRRSAKLGQAFDLLDADRAALMAQGKRSEDSAEFYEMARRVWCRHAGRLIDRVTCSDDELEPERLEELWRLGERAALSTVGVSFVDSFVAYRRAHGLTENTIAKNRGVMRSALALAKRAELWTGDMEAMFPPGFQTNYRPRGGRAAPRDG